MHCDFPDSSDEKSFDGTTSPLICSDDVMQSAMKPNYHMDRPQMSYTALISNAIRDSCCGKLLLCDIYKHIMCNHAYYRYADPGWKNSVRHALSASPVFANMAVNKTGSRKKFEWGIKGETVEEIGISPEILPDSIMYKEINTDDGQQIMKKQPKSNFSSLKNYRNKKGAQSQVRVDQVNYGNYVFMGSTAIEPPHLRSQRTIGVETIESESNNCTNWQIMSLDVNGIGCSPNESSTYSNSLMSNNPFDEYSNPAADGFDDRDFFTNAAPTDWLIPVFQSPGSFNGLFFTR